MNINHKKNSVLIFLPAKDFNEEEYLIISNQLLKSNYKIFIASDSPFVCIGSNGMKVKNDVQLYNVHHENFAGFILIGGKGTRNYWNNKLLHSISKKFYDNKKTIGAICSAPIILAKAGIIKEKATCYFDDKKELEREGIDYQNIPVFVEQKIVTAQNPQSSAEFVTTFLSLLNK